jgi:dUTPase
MITAPKIIFSKTDEDAVLPERNSLSSCGYLLRSVESKIIPDKEYTTINTGLKVENIVKGAWGLVLPIASLEDEAGVYANTLVIDNTFRGELKIKLYNSSDKGYLLNIGDVIAQITYLPLLTIEPEFNE